MKIGIRGMGLIGGSFEKAFLAVGHDVVNLKTVDERSIVNCRLSTTTCSTIGDCQLPTEARSTIGDCQLITVCLPPLMVAPWVKEHADDFGEGAVVVDAAGVKSVVCAELAETAKGRGWTFVGGHPMAGKERSGYANSDAGLFRGASMIFTPFAETDAAVVDWLKATFSEIGFARFVVTDPRRHDEMIAYTSQLAHVVSSAYVRDELSRSHLGFSAGSFQDMTRVATVDPDIWTDLFLANRESLDAVLTRLIDRLGEYRDSIRAADAAKLRALLAEGRAAKETSH